MAKWVLLGLFGFGWLENAQRNEFAFTGRPGTLFFPKLHSLNISFKESFCQCSFL